MASGPILGLGLDPSLLLKIGDVPKAVKVATNSLKELEREFAKAEKMGTQFDKAKVDRMRKLEGVIDQGQAIMAQQKNVQEMQSSAVFRQGSYGALRLQFSESHGVFGTADQGINALKKGALGTSVGALIGISPVMQVLKQLMEVPDQAIAIQNTAGDFKRGTIAAPFRTRNQQMAEELKAKETVVGQIPIIGGTLSKGYNIGVGIGSFINGEESLQRLEKKIELDEMVRRNPSIGHEVSRRLLVDKSMNIGLEIWGKLMGNPSPAIERLIADIKAADKLMTDGYKAVASGNLTGNQRKGGAGGAQDFFNRANQLVPGIGPWNAGDAFASIEAGRVAVRNFARAQMTRVYRTGD